jgi:ABC-type Zn uptake system ZnuABC Zn-binding protein ZnuA
VVIRKFFFYPIFALGVAQKFSIFFGETFAENAETYQLNYKKFEATIDGKLQEWGRAMLPFKGQSVVAYHDSWPYFAHRYGLNIDIFLEPKPGIPPSPSHLAEVIGKMKAQKIKAILVEPFQNRKTAEKVAASTGARVVDAAQFPGGMPNTETYVALIDALVLRTAAAMGGQ